ncbi:topology modulation protein [Clostridium cellulovorans]|uniref:Topology modulation protein n=1 Tax=Clostridium cellulovorans (strain ATCC 35296 / DSM 3052 / OCM 3 / 743B) TaxID=573061 RepID=D9STY8_CLOC7|nr:topology modulation protein [Clostridium cellulovorans]ADL50826.1 topology modulation protein [Clostridium cellulovorans 743B]
MKIIIIGCPGAGKSVLTKRINDFLHYPVLHLDKIYHTGGKSHITRDELVKRVSDFTSMHDKWVVDGNYISTLEMRVKLADTIIVLNIPSEICVANACKRAEENIKQGINRDDMAEGFDHTVTEEFLNFIKNFEMDTLPRVKAILKNFPDKNIKFLSNYREIEEFTEDLRKKYTE